MSETFNAKTVEQILKVTQARAEAAESEVERLKGVLGEIQLMTYCDASGKRCVNCVARSALEAKP